MEQLKNLRHLRPRQEFMLNSKQIILSTPQTMSPAVFYVRLKESIGFALGVAVTAAVLIVLFSGLYGGRSASLAKFQLTQEEAEMSIKRIDVTLDEIQYYAESAKQTSLALSEAAANNGPQTLETTTLEKEIQNLNPEIIKNPQIDDLLNQAIF